MGNSCSKKDVGEWCVNVRNSCLCMDKEKPQDVYYIPCSFDANRAFQSPLVPGPNPGIVIPGAPHTHARLNEVRVQPVQVPLSTVLSPPPPYKVDFPKDARSSDSSSVASPRPLMATSKKKGFAAPEVPQTSSMAAPAHQPHACTHHKHAVKPVPLMALPIPRCNLPAQQQLQQQQHRVVNQVPGQWTPQGLPPVPNIPNLRPEQVKPAQVRPAPIKPAQVYPVSFEKREKEGNVKAQVRKLQGNSVEHQKQNKFYAAPGTRPSHFMVNRGNVPSPQAFQQKPLAPPFNTDTRHKISEAVFGQGQFGHNLRDNKNRNNENPRFNNMKQEEAYRDRVLSQSKSVNNHHYHSEINDNGTMPYPKSYGSAWSYTTPSYSSSYQSRCSVCKRYGCIDWFHNSPSR